MKDYEPGGKMKLWLAAMRAEPERIWTSEEAAKALKTSINHVHGYSDYAVAKGVIFRTKRRNRVVYGLQPFPDVEQTQPVPRLKKRAAKGEWRPNPDDLRIPKVVPGWVPPKMVCVRQEVS